MKKTLVMIGMMSLIGVANASTLTQTEKTQVLNKIAQLEHVNGYDVQDNIKFVNTASNEQIRQYLVDLTYNVQKEIDNPNALDLEDIRVSLQKKTLAELTK